ncbi:hypothetical protein Vafri_10600 [Volvox africanus]|uniref:Uncharacterized protein n=1 Tax=Volvox africanus TaxID=51714 RepID=A0A8J4EZR6_9CHLO|nr:hypothetical protein Vafri_10600 [Volvox africanus]
MPLQTAGAGPEAAEHPHAAAVCNLRGEKPARGAAACAAARDDVGAVETPRTAAVAAAVAVTEASVLVDHGIPAAAAASAGARRFRSWPGPAACSRPSAADATACHRHDTALVAGCFAAVRCHTHHVPAQQCWHVAGGRCGRRSLSQAHLRGRWAHGPWAGGGEVTEVRVMVPVRHARQEAVAAGHHRRRWDRWEVQRYCRGQMSDRWLWCCCCLEAVGAGCRRVCLSWAAVAAGLCRISSASIPPVCAALR